MHQKRKFSVNPLLRRMLSIVSNLFVSEQQECLQGLHQYGYQNTSNTGNDATELVSNESQDADFSDGFAAVPYFEEPIEDFPD